MPALRAPLAVLILALLAACGSDPGSCCEVTLTVEVPADTPTVYLAASLPQLGPWAPDGVALSGESSERSVTVVAAPGTTFEYKFTLGSWNREALGADGSARGNFELRVKRGASARHVIDAFKRDPLEYMADWRGSGVEGTLVYWRDVESAYLRLPRHVGIWLPPGYAENADKRYPVLYMHDGQNLFDPRIANTGIDWGVDEAVVRLSADGVIEPVIVVGVWSTADRAPEYSPWHGAPDYARFLIEELKPRVDAEFRTLDGPDNTAVMGSSMGGLLSFYLVTNHPEVFGACGCVSTHFPLSAADMSQFSDQGPSRARADRKPYIKLDIAAGLTVPDGARYWFDYGGKGLDARYGPTHKGVRRWLLKQGKTEGEDFVVRRYPDATHNEAAWRARLDDPLRFLFASPD